MLRSSFLLRQNALNRENDPFMLSLAHRHTNIVIEMHLLARCTIPGTCLSEVLRLAAYVCVFMYACVTFSPFTLKLFDTIILIHVKYCDVVVPIDLYPFMSLKVTLNLLQGNSSVKNLKLNVILFFFFFFFWNFRI